MKRYNLSAIIILLLLLLNISSFSQNRIYHRMTSNYGWCCWQFQSLGYWPVGYENTGITIINNKAWTKLVRIGPASGVSYLYEINSSKTVWYKPNYNADSILLYDFSLSEGDDFLVHFTFGDTILYQVTLTDSIETNLGWCKRIILNTTNPEFWELEWIQGIGCTIGPIYVENILDPSGFYQHFCLECVFSEPNILAFSNSGSCFFCNPTGCGLVVGLEENPSDAFQSRIENNGHGTRIIFNNTYIKISSLILFDVRGSKIIQISNINSNSAVINTEGLKRGLYVIQMILNDRKVVTSKLMLL